MLNQDYVISNPDELFTPALVFYPKLIQHNLETLIRLAGGTAKLRPHVKTHKCPDIVKLQVAAGIHKHKCATIAEAEMLAQSGARDILIAYPLVGPNCLRLAKLMKEYPKSRFSALIDHPESLRRFSEVMSANHLKLDCLIDLNVGMNRTGIAVGADAIELYRAMSTATGIQIAGFHVYDGQNHQQSLEERKAAVEAMLKPVLEMRATVEAMGLAVPKIICGGTPTYPIFAAMDLPGLECSPGTFILHDHGYGTKFSDLTGFVPAAVVLSRVVSRPGGNRITIDLGTKAVASDPPAGSRCQLLNVPEYKYVSHNEEHLVVETLEPNNLVPGDLIYTIPTHICPTCALHAEATIVENGKVVDTWSIVARDRYLTV